MSHPSDHVASPFGLIQVGSTWSWQGEAYQVQSRVRWRERWQAQDAARDSHGVWVYDEWQLRSAAGHSLRLIEDESGVREVSPQPDQPPGDQEPVPPFDPDHQVQPPYVAGSAKAVFAESEPLPADRPYRRYRFQGRDFEVIRTGAGWQHRQLTPLPLIAVEAALATDQSAREQARSRQRYLIAALGTWLVLGALALWYSLAYPGELVVQQWWSLSASDSMAVYPLPAATLAPGTVYRLELRAPDLGPGTTFGWSWPAAADGPAGPVVWQDSLYDRRGQDRQGTWREWQAVSSVRFHLREPGPLPGGLLVTQPPETGLRVRVSLWRGGWNSEVWVLLLLIGAGVIFWVGRMAAERLPGRSWPDRRWYLAVVILLLLGLGVGYFFSSNGWGFDGLLDSPLQASEIPVHRE